MMVCRSTTVLLMATVLAASCGGASPGSAPDLDAVRDTPDEGASGEGSAAPDPAEGIELVANDVGLPDDGPPEVPPDVPSEPPAPAFPTGVRLEYPDLLNLKNTPVADLDLTAFAFGDQGSWHEFALPSADRDDLWGGFTGPLQQRSQTFVDWLSEALLVVRVMDEAGTELPFVANADTDLRAWPGALVQHLAAGDVFLELALVFADARTAIVRLSATAPAGHDVPLALAFRGTVFPLQPARLGVADGTVVASAPGQEDSVVVAFPADLGIDLVASPDGLSWSGRPTRSLVLPAGGSLTRYFAIARYLDAGERAARAPGLPGMLANGAAAFAANDVRWNAWLAAVLIPGNPWAADADHRAVAVKALETLAFNWRGAWGDLLHDGLWPSSDVQGYHALWAWDSWKHAVALSRFAPALAKDQVRAMLDWQRDDGMVPDTVNTDHAADYWYCTKPPLAAWAVAQIQARSPDAAFLAEVVPKILKYHRWRYQARDHDGNGLCEYGSSHDTLLDGGNDSGMDNAMRFDGATMLQNGPDTWSFDRESVDLNAYLWAEKGILAGLYDAMGDATTASGLRAEADVLGPLIRQTFWDDASGWFYDVRLADRSFVRIQGPEGWTPLYVGLATPEQAARVRAQMTDPAKFWTPLPFPSVAADTPGFKPFNGYWRGPVWLDQAWFAIQALQRYGFADDAREAARRMIEVPQGLFRANGPIRETYDPRDGTGQNSNDFGWSAAHLLLLFAP